MTLENFLIFPTIDSRAAMITKINITENKRNSWKLTQAVKIQFNIIRS